MSKVPSESERRQATILFADISGFTAMSERLDPEEVTHVMNECFQELGAVVVKHGGVIDKFIGDCVMALFGAPKALEGAPQRAVSAALEMLDEIGAINRKRGLETQLGIHVGINTGEVVSGLVGSAQKSDFTVMGDAVNLASRLKDLAPTGSILVGPATWRSTRAVFRYTPGTRVSIKGKSEPVQVFTVQSMPGGDEQNPERMIHSALVGRDKELLALKMHAQALAEGRGSIVNLIGEAGVGKSRLCAEFYSSGSLSSVTILEGRSLTVGQTLSYYPVISILKTWAAIKDDDTETASLKKLEDAIRAVYPSGVEEVLPFIATLMGYRLSGERAALVESVLSESLGKIIIKHLKDLILHACAIKPLLFVLEDLHWADESSIELIRSLVALTEKHSLMFLCAWRPGYADTTERFHEFLFENHRARVFDITLTPLEESSAVLLTKNLLRSAGVPERILARIIEKSGCNPFFIEEVIRSFIDQGLLRFEDERSSFHGDIDAIEIPDSIDAVIMSRVDRLDSSMRDLLRVASVIGRSFFYKILAHVYSERDTLGACLDGLRELQLIRELNRSEELEYLFKHVLVQETIYRSMLIKNRKQLHLSVAKAIEELFAERLQEFFAVLAFHYSQAEDMDKAGEYLEKAGQAALESSASSEALLFFQKALNIFVQKMGASAPRERMAAFEGIIARAYQNKGMMVHAVEHYDLALGYYGIKLPGKILKYLRAFSGFLSLLKYLYLPFTRSSKPPKPVEASINVLMINRIWAVKDIDSTEWFLSGFIATSRILRHSLHATPGGLAMLCGVSQLLTAAGISSTLSGKILDVVRPNLVDEYDRHIFIDGEQWLMLLYGVRESHLDLAHLDFLIRCGDFARIDIYLLFCGMYYVFTGAFDKAEVLAAKYLELAEAYDNSGWLMKGHEITSLIAHTRRSEVEEASNVKTMIEITEKIGSHSFRKIFLAYLVNILLRKGDLDAAAKYVSEIQLLLEQEGVSIPLQVVPCHLAILAFTIAKLRNCTTRAERLTMVKSTRRVLSAVRWAGPRFIMRYPEALRLVGSWYHLTGKQRAALRIWKMGLDTGEKLGTRPENARLCFELARALESTHSSRTRVNGQQWEFFRDKARSAFVELALVTDLGELDEWEAQLG